MRFAVKTPRPYHSQLREAQIRQTRRQVLSSARELFLRDGYPATTVTAIARHAGVAADTVYKAFGTKQALLKELIDVVVGGDDVQTALLDRPGPQAMRLEPNQRRQIAMFAAGVTDQLERIRPTDDILRGAAAVDPDAAALRADVQLRQRRQAMRTVVSWIADHGPLQAGVSADNAAAVVWTLSSPEVHQMLRDAWGWSREQYERWLRETLIATLLPPPAG